MKKKLLTALFSFFIFFNNSLAEEITITCFIQDPDLKAIAKKDRPRFTGQTISLKIDTERKIITNTKPDSELYVIHGIIEQVETEVTKRRKSQATSTTVVTKDIFLERSKKIVAKKKVTLSKDYKNLKKSTVITFENVKDFTAEEWFNIPVDDRRSLRDLKFAKEKYMTLPVSADEAKDNSDELLKALNLIFGDSYSYNSEMILLDDKDNEIIYKYAGTIKTGMPKILEIKINDSRSAVDALLYKNLEFKFRCG